MPRSISVLAPPLALFAVVWFNRYDGEVDERVVHRGGVAEGDKMAAQVWIHEREYERSLP